MLGSGGHDRDTTDSDTHSDAPWWSLGAQQDIHLHQQQHRGKVQTVTHSRQALKETQPTAGRLADGHLAPRARPPPALSRRRQVKQEVEDFSTRSRAANSPSSANLLPWSRSPDRKLTQNSRMRRVQGAICRPSSTCLPVSEQRDTCARSSNGPGGGAKLAVGLAAKSGQAFQNKRGRVASCHLPCCENVAATKIIFVHSDVLPCQVWLGSTSGGATSGRDD